ncbi:phosphotransferase [Micromonospora narathiwatensis]|uniref:Predicted kinase, aminoglycoside phosphotransferase (APT) family n=1 Tax=Micromonospora narathiwatensis TaxID=299146 RepID=A0A1A8Z9P5_9ACTN|nr:phosphotransferase [Micromonospora narathiwatensis]SBT40529.1 Predicted kinase, aminoglycoside phosphotransferase (APT) family [Micromonospora narathiwatensis]
MTTALSEAIAQELRVHLNDVCAQIGVDPDGASLVKYTMNAVFVAPPLVIRLAAGSHAATLAHRVVSVAACLEMAGRPAVRLAPGIAAQPFFSGDWVATAWRYVPTVSDEPKPVDLAAPLRALHSLDRLDVALPRWSPIGKFRRRLDAAAALAHEEAAELERWSRTKLGIGAADLLRELRLRCDQAEEDLDRVAWQLPPGVIHGDAHTGNVLLPAAGYGAVARPEPLLCDLDGVCIGPREWDLVPTAHGATRFGRSPADYQEFVEVYGFDITAWAGWPVLRRVRELQLVTSTIDSLAGRPDVARELAHRLRSLLSDDLDVKWRRYQ